MAAPVAAAAASGAATTGGTAAAANSGGMAVGSAPAGTGMQTTNMSPTLQDSLMENVAAPEDNPNAFDAGGEEESAGMGGAWLKASMAIGGGATLFNLFM